VAHRELDGRHLGLRLPFDWKSTLRHGGWGAVAWAIWKVGQVAFLHLSH
jgi:hypothetical protein